MGRRKENKRDKNLRLLQQQIQQQLEEEAAARGEQVNIDFELIQKQAQAMVQAATQAKAVVAAEKKRCNLQSLTTNQLVELSQVQAEEIVKYNLARKRKMMLLGRVSNHKTNLQDIDYETQVQIQAQALEHAYTQAQNVDVKNDDDDNNNHNRNKIRIPTGIRDMRWIPLSPRGSPKSSPRQSPRKTLSPDTRLESSPLLQPSTSTPNMSTYGGTRASNVSQGHTPQAMIINDDNCNDGTLSLSSDGRRKRRGSFLKTINAAIIIMLVIVMVVYFTASSHNDKENDSASSPHFFRGRASLEGYSMPQTDDDAIMDKSDAGKNDDADDDNKKDLAMILIRSSFLPSSKQKETSSDHPAADSIEDLDSSSAETVKSSSTQSENRSKHKELNKGDTWSNVAAVFTPIATSTIDKTKKNSAKIASSSSSHDGNNKANDRSKHTVAIQTAPNVEQQHTAQTSLHSDGSNVNTIDQPHASLEEDAKIAKKDTVFPVHKLPATQPQFSPTHAPQPQALTPDVLHVIDTQAPPPLASMPDVPRDVDTDFAGLLLDDQAFYFPFVSSKILSKDKVGNRRLQQHRVLHHHHDHDNHHHNNNNHHNNHHKQDKQETNDSLWAATWKKSTMKDAAPVDEYYRSKGQAMLDAYSNATTTTTTTNGGSNKKSKSISMLTFSPDWALDTTRGIALGQTYKAVGGLIKDHYQQVYEPNVNTKGLQRMLSQTSQSFQSDHSTWSKDWERGMKLSELYQNISDLIEDHYNSMEGATSYTEEALLDTMQKQGHDVAANYRQKSSEISNFYAGKPLANIVANKKASDDQLEQEVAGTMIDNYYKALYDPRYNEDIMLQLPKVHPNKVYPPWGTAGWQVDRAHGIAIHEYWKQYHLVMDQNYKQQGKLLSNHYQDYYSKEFMTD